MSENSGHHWLNKIGMAFIWFLNGSRSFFRQKSQVLLTGLVLGSLPILGIIFSGQDKSILTQIQQPTPSHTHKAAQYLSEFGEFQYSTLLVSGIFIAAGIIKSRRAWRRVGYGVLVAGIIGGILVNVFRPTFGRARPHMEDGGEFTYFRMNSRYQGFPSGHTTSTTASLSALAFLAPHFAAPACILSVAVGWSRMQVNRHYLSDVMGGLLLGSFCGFWVGWVYKRKDY